MRKHLSVILAVALFCLPGRAAQGMGGKPGGMGGKPGGIGGGTTAAGATPSVVDTGADFSGSGTMTYPHTLVVNNTLVIWTYANDTTLTHTCSDSKGNTYTPETGGAIADAGGGAIAGRLFHALIATGGTGVVITCTGTTPAVTGWQLTGCAANPCVLDTTSAGTNPSMSGVDATPITPAAFTPAHAAVVHIDGYADASGGVITLTQVNGSFSIDQSALNGGTSFIGGMGHFTASSSSSIADGWNSSTAADHVAGHAAYR